jgi:hypothetical protein
MYLGMQVTSTGVSDKKPLIFLLDVMTTGLWPADSQSIIPFITSFLDSGGMALSTIRVVFGRLAIGSLLAQALNKLNNSTAYIFFILIFLFQKSYGHKNVLSLNPKGSKP